MLGELPVQPVQSEARALSAEDTVSARSFQTSRRLCGPQLLGARQRLDGVCVSEAGQLLSARSRGRIGG